MVQASFTKGFWRSAKADFWKKLEEDERAASTPQRAASNSLHIAEKKKKSE